MGNANEGVGALQKKSVLKCLNVNVNVTICFISRIVSTHWQILKLVKLSHLIGNVFVLFSYTSHRNMI